ncbi:MAG: purine-nucleoside phosphorylase [Bdellovibrionota bacterium]
MLAKSLDLYQGFLARHFLPVPKWHVVLGSGFGAALDSFSWELVGELSFSELPGLHKSTVQDHAGAYRFYRRGKTVISFQMGRLHGYEGLAASAVARTVMIPRMAGVEDFLLTNASGGLSSDFKPGDVMLIRDHVNFTGQNPLTGANPLHVNGAELGPRFPDLCDAYDSEWRKRLENSCRKQGLAVHEGVYLGVAGPSFETPAEVKLFASWGMHAVGMSTVWEAIALRHSGARLAGLSLISNLGAGLGKEKLEHETILRTSRASAAKIIGALELAAGEAFGQT